MCGSIDSVLTNITLNLLKRKLSKPSICLTKTSNCILVVNPQPYGESWKVRRKVHQNEPADVSAGSFFLLNVGHPQVRLARRQLHDLMIWKLLAGLIFTERGWDQNPVTLLPVSRGSYMALINKLKCIKGTQHLIKIAAHSAWVEKAEFQLQRKKASTRKGHTNSLRRTQRGHRLAEQLLLTVKSGPMICSARPARCAADWPSFRPSFSCGDE